MFAAMTRAVVRHRLVVIAVWVLVAVAGIAASSALPGRLTALTSVPDSQSARANEILATNFGENDDGAFTIIYEFKQATPREIERMQAQLAAAVAEIPTASVLQQRALAGTLFAFVGTDFPLLEAAAQTEPLRAALKRQGLPDALVSGPPALQHDVRPLLADDLRNGTVIAVVLALLLLLAALGWTRALIVPFAVAGATVAGSLCVILLVSLRFSMVLYIPNVVELIGLGLAIDYSLLVVHRFRAELRDAGDATAAVVRTMSSAGRTVALSGLTAAAGLSVLFVMPVPFVRSLGAAGLIVPAVAVLATLTLQPALLSLLGARGVATSGVPGLLASASAPRIWERIAGNVQRRPGRTFLASLVLLGIIAAPVGWMQLAPASLTAIRSDAESMRAVDYLTSKAGAGVITPHQVLVDLGREGVATSPAMDAARLRFATTLSKLPESFAAVTDTTTIFTDRMDRYQRFLVIGRHGFEDKATQQLVRDLRALDPTNAGYPSTAELIVGGAPAQGVDFLDRVTGALPWIVFASLLLAYLLMARSFRSRLMPLVAVMLNLVSVLAALGVVALVFHFGVGAWLIQAQQTDYLESWSVVFLFAMLFGLSMDYQVFLMSRIRELRASGLEMSEAIARGLGSTGTVISVAAIIFVGALTGLVVGHVAGLQQLGLGLGVGVLIDATIVRGLLLPSALMLLRHRADFGQQ